MYGSGRLGGPAVVAKRVNAEVGMRNTDCKLRGADLIRPRRRPRPRNRNA
jgi:hypothetical protein